MDKYQALLADSKMEDNLLSELYNQVCDGKIEEAKMTAMRIKAIKDLKWELRKLDEHK